MGVTTRALAVDDWREWRSLRLKALADAPAAFGSGLSEWIDATGERWRSRVRDVPLNVIAALDNEPVGQVSAMNGSSAESVELISMWVAPNARGMGVGNVMIDAVISWSAGQGASGVQLSVKASNLPARHLYERNHFRFVDDIEDGDGEVQMVRKLA
jgi:ribosomal protein S18 acetylase RimI-like enzyme